MDTALQIKIIAEPSPENEYFIVYKPSGLPSAPLSENDDYNAFSQLAKIYPDLLQVQGRKTIEHGLIHRIDTVTEGLIIIASSQEGYEKLLYQQKNNQIKKYYKAKCDIKKIEAEGFPSNNFNFNYKINDTYSIESFFRPFGNGHKEVRPVTTDSNEAALKKVGKKVLYTTDVKILSKDPCSVTVECNINNGFRHQVRCHLTWIGLPIKGDILYNPNTKDSKIYFSAYKLEVNNRTFQIEVDY